MVLINADTVKVESGARVAGPLVRFSDLPGVDLKDGDRPHKRFPVFSSK